MEALSFSPFLHRRSLRHSSNTPTRFSLPKSPYKYYFQPKTTFQGLKTAVNQNFSTLETDVKTYITEAEERTGEIRLKKRDRTPGGMEVGREKPKPTLARNRSPALIIERSASEDPKPTPVRLQVRIAAERFAPIQRKDSLTALLESNRTEDNFERIESIVEKLKDDRSVLPAPCLDDLLAEVLTRQQLQTSYKSGIWPSHGSPTDPISVFSHACDEMNVAPVPALAKLSGNKLILNRYQLQTALCKALAKTIPVIDVLNVVHLDQNNISDAGGAAIIEGIGRQGKVVSFYYTRNEVGMKVVEAIHGLKDCIVEEVSFKGCKVVPPALCPLISSTLQLKRLTKLSLSEIGLTESATHALTASLKRSKVTQLDISYNQMNLTSAKLFMSFLRRDKRLQYLDYSWNSLASSDNEVAYLLGAILRTHPSLIHVNLSETGLNDQAMALLGQGLKKSSTIVGLHLTGNPVEDRTIDYLKRHLDARVETQLLSNSAETRPIPISHPESTQSFPTIPHRTSPSPCESSLTNLRIRDSSGKRMIAHRDSLVNIFQSEARKADLYEENRVLTRLLGHAEVANSEQWVYSEHCWVCERWPIFTFLTKETALKPVESVDLLTSRFESRCKLALKGSFNNWHEVEMMETSPGEHSVSLLLPPGLHKFWFLFSEQYICVAGRYRCAEEAGVRINQVSIPIRTADVTLLEATKEEKVRTFDKNKSVFKSFIEDTDALIDIMFANDMKYSKIKRIVKSEEDFVKVKAVLRENYKEIKAIFDHTAASSNYPTIGWLDFTDFSNMCQLIDKKFLNTAAIDRLFIAVNVELVEQEENPNRELCRFEFAEIIVRMALCKYQDLSLPPVDCLRKLLTEHILRYGPSSNAIEFRKEKLYQIEVNDVIEVNLFNLQSIFAKYKDRRGKFVHIKGIKSMLEAAQVAYNERDLLKDFAFSKMSILDESNAHGAHEKMVFVEFLEFIGRMSESVVEETLPLYRKIEQVLDTLLHAHGLVRKPVSDLQMDED